MGYVGLLISDKERAAPLAAELEAEEVQEIELAWQSTAQRSLGHAPQAQAVPVEGLLEAALTAAAKPDIIAAAESAREQAAPPGGLEPEEKPAGGLEASPLPARKRGRPKKTEGGEKAEKKGQAGAGKRQKSLFDF